MTTVFNELPCAIQYVLLITYICSIPGGSEGKASARNAGDPGSIPESGSSPGEGNGNPLQHSCLENPMRSLVGYSP